MKISLKSHHPIRHARSFSYAFSGILHAIINEANFRVQIFITIIAIVLGIYYKISTIEWSVLVLSLGFLLSAELINTTVEEFVDHLVQEHHEGARVIKDLSAGYVLTAAITTLIVMILVFLE
jgi:diacylglycerol kinase